MCTCHIKQLCDYDFVLFYKRGALSLGYLVSIRLAYEMKLTRHLTDRKHTASEFPVVIIFNRKGLAERKYYADGVQMVTEKMANECNVL